WRWPSGSWSAAPSATWSTAPSGPATASSAAAWSTSSTCSGGRSSTSPTPPSSPAPRSCSSCNGATPARAGPPAATGDRVKEVVPRALDGQRLDRVVALVAGVSRAEAAALVAGGAVRVAGRPVTARAQRLAAGDEIEVDLPEPSGDAAPAPDPAVAVPVVYEDEHLLVVDKPAGLVVHPGAGQESGTLVNGLLARYPGIRTVGQPDRPGIVHRLDRGTSGLMLVALTPTAYGALVDMLASRSVDRRYRVLVWGVLPSPTGLVDAPIGRSARDRTRMAVTVDGKPARTRYEVLREYHEPVEVSELRCRLETGRTHQIRVH